MANTFNPQGLLQLSGAGSAPTFDMSSGAIKNGSTTAVFFGDPMVHATGTTGLGTGYLTQATGPVAVTISGGVLTAGVLTFTFTALAAAPAVGATIVVYGGTSTAAPANGPYTIIASSTTTAAVLFSGAYTTGTASGYIYTPLVGVFAGCNYQSTAQKRVTWQNYWPGTSDSAGDISCRIIVDPNARFSIQSANSNTTATAVSFASVGQNIGINYLNSGGSQTNGNTSNGLSTYFADQYTLPANFPTGYTGQAYLPFRIIGLQNSTVGGGSGPLSGVNGWDPTTAYNDLVVSFNYVMSNQLNGV